MSLTKKTLPFYAHLLALLLALVLPAAARAAEETFDLEPFGKVTVYHQTARPTHVALFISGDGGWNLGVVDMARELAGMDGLVAAIERAFYRAYDRLERIVRRRPAPEPQLDPEPIEDVALEEVDPSGFVSQNAVQSPVTASLDGGIPHTTRHTEPIPCQPSCDQSCRVD